MDPHLPPPTSPDDYVSPQVVSPSPPPPPRPAPPRSPAGVGRWIGRLLLLAMMGSFGLIVLLLVGLLSGGGILSLAGDETIHEQHHSLVRGARHKVAIIALEGTILQGDGFVKRQIDQIRRDEKVKAVVLRINSPGGTVTGSDYLYHHLGKLALERKLPIVVSMGGMAASGGYYVAMAVGDTPQSIYAEPTTWTGSIGVVIPHYNFGGLMSEWKVEEDSIKSHRLKQMGSPTRAMTEEERQIFQALVDDSFARFKDIVKAGRPYFRVHEDDLVKVATGQVFTTRQALDNHLVDKEGFLEDAIDRAMELAALDKEHTEVVKYKHFGGLLDALLSAQSRTDSTSELAALVELTSPRAYYLCTWLPTLAVNRKAGEP